MPDAFELTDEELCMLEQLCYLNAEVAQAAGAEEYAGISGRDGGLSVQEILAPFDGKALEQLREKGAEEVGSSCVSGEEWAGMISWLQQSRLRELEVRDAMPGEDGISLAVTYAHPGQEGHAVVAFKGTTGDGEWVDNIEGMRAADTAAQRQALRYIETQPYEQITVTGHSKGANKAMYVTLLSDRVTRCAAFDGQGFSGEFIGKYRAEIQSRAGRIRNYSIDTDFVHILLFPVPGSRQIYCRGFGIDNVKQHHSPNSFFSADTSGRLLTDADGRPVFVTEEGGRPVPEDPALTRLHRFTAYLLNNAPDGEKDQIIGFLSALVPLVRAEGDPGEKRTAILRLTGENTAAVSGLLAWLGRYAQQYGYGTAEIDQLLRALGTGTLDEMLGVSVSKEALEKAGLSSVWEKAASLFGLDPAGPHAGLSTVLAILLHRLTNGKKDRDIQGLLVFLDMALAYALGVPLHLAVIWQSAEGRIGQIRGTCGAGDRQCAPCRIRDFSDSMWAAFADALERADGVCACTAEGWQAFAGEAWFSRIRAGALDEALEAYAAAVRETDRRSRTQADRIFAEVHRIDARHAAGLREITNAAGSLRDRLASCGGA